MKKILTERFHKFTVLALVLACLSSTLACPAYGAESANYSIDTNVLSGGGSDCSSPNFFLMSTLGQSTAIGPASSANYLNYAGFWYTVPQQPQGCYWLGDINCDDNVDISDVILVLRIALQLDPPAPCSNINGDSTVDISDVILTLRMALALDPKVPC